MTTMKLFAPKFQTWLKSFVERNNALSGMVHLFLRGRLEMAAALDVPVKTRQDFAKVQLGVGMMGLALERNQPVRPTDLAEGDAVLQPGARDAVALPVPDASGDGVRAVVVLAFTEELTSETVDELLGSVASLPPF